MPSSRTKFLEETTRCTMWLWRRDQQIFTTGMMKPLLTSPYTEGAYFRRGSRAARHLDRRRIVSPSSPSVGTEPLDGVNEAERARRAATLEILEIDPADGRIRVVAPLPSGVHCDWAQWSQSSNTLRVGFRNLRKITPFPPSLIKLPTQGWSATEKNPI